MRVWYATREDIKDALDTKATASSNRKIYNALQSASNAAEGLLRRRYYPELTTRYFDWPNFDRSPTYQLWLDNNEVISVVSLVSGGVTIPPTDYILRRSDKLQTPPYTHIEISLGTASTFTSGLLTFQQSIALTALFGYKDEQNAGIDPITLATTVNSSITTVDVSHSADIGTGSILNLELERVQVTARSLLTTATTLTAQMDSLASVTNAAVTDGTKHHEGETLVIDNETMTVRSVNGNNLTVVRAQDGSPLAVHTNGATLFAPRRLTVVRGFLGTTAAAHNAAIPILIQAFPGPVVALTRAYAINILLQEQSGYARTSGSGDHQKEYTGRGIAQLEEDARFAVGRSQGHRTQAI